MFCKKTDGKRVAEAIQEELAKAQERLDEEREDKRRADELAAAQKAFEEGRATAVEEEIQRNVEAMKKKRVGNWQEVDGHFINADAVERITPVVQPEIEPYQDWGYSWGFNYYNGIRPGTYEQNHAWVYFKNNPEPVEVNLNAFTVMNLLEK